MRMRPTSWSSFGGGAGAGVDGFFATVGGGGGGCSGGRGRIGLLFDADIPRGRAPPKPPFSGSGTSPGVSGLSSIEVSNTSCNGCGPEETRSHVRSLVVVGETHVTKAVSYLMADSPNSWNCATKAPNVWAICPKSRRWCSSDWP